MDCWNWQPACVAGHLKKGASWELKGEGYGVIAVLNGSITVGPNTGYGAGQAVVSPRAIGFGPDAANTEPTTVTATADNTVAAVLDRRLMHRFLVSSNALLGHVAFPGSTVLNITAVPAVPGRG